MSQLSKFLGEPIAIGQPVEVLVGSQGSGAAAPNYLEDGKWVQQGAVYLKSEYADLYDTIGSIGSSPFTPVSVPGSDLTSITDVAYGANLYVVSAQGGKLNSINTIVASDSLPSIVLFNGTSDYLRADDALLSISSTGTPFTIECWIYPLTLSGLNSIIGMNTKAAGTNVLIVNTSSVTYASTTLNFSTAFTLNEWQHFAISFDGANIRVFRNGALVANVASAMSAIPSLCVLGIAAEFDAANGGTPGDYFHGYITNFRVTSGRARYTAAFTPPTEPLTADEFTSLLTCNSLDFVDQSVNETAITVFSSPQIITTNFNPFTAPDNWTSIVTGTTSNINSLIYENDHFLAGGDLGVIIESANGVNWRYPAVSIDDQYGLYNLINVNGVSTVMGANGQGRRSSDEIWWTPINTGTTSSIRAVTLGSLNTSNTTQNIRAMIRQSNTYVAVGGNGLLMTSTDAVTWNTPIPLPNGSTVTLNAITYGGFRYVIAGDEGLLATADNLTNPLTWRFSGLSLVPATISAVGNVLGVRLGFGEFLLGANSGQLRQSLPNDKARSWRVLTSNNTTDNVRVFTHLRFGPRSGYWIGGNNTMFQYSNNASTWSTVDSGLTTTTSAINAIIMGGDNNYLYAATGGTVGISNNGIDWTTYATGLTTDLNDAVYADNRYVVASGGTTGLVLRTSTNGTDWSSVTFGATATIYKLLHGAGIYIAAGAAGVIRTSTDAATWTARTSGTSSQIQAGVFNNDNDNPLFVVGGVGGYLATSTDGITWTARTSGTTGNIVGITMADYVPDDPGGKLYAYVTSTGLSGTSTDAVTWTTFQNNREANTNHIYSLAAQPGGGYDYLYGSINGIIGFSDGSVEWTNPVSGALATAAGNIWAMTYNPDSDKFVFAGGSGYIATSGDGTTWTYYGTGINLSTFGSSGSYINNRYVVLSQNGQIRTSTDLERWEAYRPLSSTGFLYSLAWSGSLYVLAGATVSATGSGIATSTDLVTWTAQTSGVTVTIQTVTYGDGIFVFGGQAGILRTSTDGITWTARTSGTATTAFISEIIYAGGQYLYVNSVGGISTSTNAITWTARTSGTASALRRIVYANNLYIAGGVGNNLRSSTDGITWTARAIGVTNTIYGITYGNGLYVIAGQTGMLRSSTDLVTWTARTSGTASDIYSLNYDSTTSKFYYVDSNGNIGTSTDAITWSVLADRNQGTGSFYSLFYDFGVYLAGGISGAIAQSNNAETWTTQTSGNTLTTFTVTSVLYADNLYVYGAQGGHIGTSTDGITWSRSDSETIRQVNSLVYRSSGGYKWAYAADNGIVGTSNDAITWQLGAPNSQYVMVGAGGMVQTSTDAITWTPQTSGTTTEFYNVAYGGGQYLASGPAVLRTSTDGVTWAAITTTATYWGLAYAGNQNLWTICGAGGLLATATNLVTGAFTARTSGTATTAILYQLQYKNNLWMHAGNGGLFTSTNAITWTARTSNASGTIWSLTYGQGSYLYGDENGGIGSSLDGITWSRTSVIPAERIYGLTYDSSDSEFVFVSRFGLSGKSADGINWSVRPRNAADTSENINSLAYANNIYVAAANAGVLRSSTDTITWTAGTSGVVEAINEVAFTGNTWIAVGQSGLFRTSTNGEIWLSRGLAVTEVPAGASLASDGSGVFVQGAAGGHIRRSTDGQDWSGQTTDTTSLIQSVAYGNGQWAFGTNGTTLLNLRYSDDGGNTWQTAASGATNTITAIVYGDNGWAVGFQDGAVRSTATLTTSPTWTGRIAASGAKCNSLVYANGLYVAAFNLGVIYSSTNIVTWTQRTTGTARNILTLTFGNGTWVYAGTNGILATSTDTATWVQRESATTLEINCLAFGGANTFVYAGDRGVIATSTDAISWTKRNSNTNDTIMNMIWDSGSAKFLYSTRSGSTATSTDGVTWTQPIASYQTGTKENLKGIATSNTGTTFIVGSNSFVASSTNYIDWTRIETGFSGNFNSITYDDKFIVAGEDGILLTSTDAVTWVEENSGTDLDITNTKYQGNLYFYTASAVLASSQDAETVEFSPSYNIDTEFLVPDYTKFANVSQLGNNLTQANVEVYVKAKN